MKVTERISQIIEFAKEGDKFCDIGCDHGFVGINLILDYDAKLVIFSDVLRLPLSNAIKNVSEYNVDSSLVCFRVGDGLQTIEKHEVDTVIITGMGGKNIINILSYDIDKTKTFARFVLQPTNGEDILRKWLCENKFVINNESLIEESGKFYETFLVSNGKEELSHEQIKFGKCLNYTDKTFVRKYSEILGKLEETRNQIPDNYIDTINEFNAEIYSIKKVLNIKDR